MPLAATVVVAFATVACGAAPPWSRCDLLPADVDLYVHVDDAAGLRRQWAAMPLLAAVRAAFIDERVSALWSNLARNLGRSEAQCFDQLLGRDLIFAMRHEGDRSEWLLVTEMDAATVDHLFNGLGGRHLGGGFLEFPAQGVVATWRDSGLYIAPSVDSTLLRSALDRVFGPRGSKQDPQRIAQDAAASPPPDRLSEHRLLRDAASWPDSRAQIFVRHSTPMAGESVIAFDCRDRSVKVRQRGRLAEELRAPVTPAPPPLRREVLRRFDTVALAGSISQQSSGTISALWAPWLPEARACEGFRRNLGDRWMVLVGEVDGDSRVPCRVPAVAVAFEVREVCLGRRQHEELVARAIQCANARWGKALGGAIPVPEPAACTDIEAPRHCDLNRTLRNACTDHPLVRTCSLHWRTVEGGDGNWQVYATHREWLDRVAQALEPKVRPEDAPVNEDAPSGFLDTRATASLIEGWGDSADQFYASDPARFRDAVALVASMLRGIERVRWQVDRPECSIIETTLSIELAQPSSP